MSTFENTQDSENTRRRIRVPDSFQTTNAIAQTAFQIPVPQATAFYIQVRVIAVKPDISAEAVVVSEGAFRRPSGGNVIRATGNGGLVGVLSKTLSDFSSVLGITPTVDLVANTTSQTIDIRVSGQSGITINWYFDILTLRNLN